MLYHLFEYLEQAYNFPGAGLFRYLSFRSAMSFLLAFFIGIFYGKKIIYLLKKQQIGETVRDLGLQGQKEKEGTPTMGGIIIIIATLIPVLLFTDLTNIYIQLLIITILWMGAIGFLDDYIKVIKKDKGGLRGKFKVLGQLVLGIFMGIVIFYHPDITIRTENRNIPASERTLKNTFGPPKKSLETTLPILTNNTFNYSWLLPKKLRSYEWLLLLLTIGIVTFIVTGVSNATNLTDGIDGLAAGTSAVVVSALALLAWISGNIIFTDYLNIMFIPGVGEISVFLSAFTGAILAFLWYNAFPAYVFMGDTGSLTIGAVIALIAIFIRKELLLPVLAGIFVAETLSVIIQTRYFKYTKRKYGQGKRVFKMAPLHHHFQKLGLHENKIVVRFWIVSILLAVASIALLKVR